MIEIKRITSASSRIKEAMSLIGKTRVDLVRETGLNKSTISRYLSGEIEPKQPHHHRKNRPAPAKI